MKLLLSILVIIVATVPMVSSRQPGPPGTPGLPGRPASRGEIQATFVRSNGMLKRVARDAEFSLKSLETAAQDNDAGCRFESCKKLEELKKALLAIIENLTCPDEPEVATESYLGSNDLDLGLIDL